MSRLLRQQRVDWKEVQDGAGIGRERVKKGKKKGSDNHGKTEVNKVL